MLGAANKSISFTDCEGLHDTYSTVEGIGDWMTKTTAIRWLWLQWESQLNAYYCQQVWRHWGPVQSLRCAGLNTHSRRSHLIWSFVSEGIGSRMVSFTSSSGFNIRDRFVKDDIRLLWILPPTRFIAWPHLQSVVRSGLCGWYSVQTHLV